MTLTDLARDAKFQALIDEHEQRRRLALLDHGAHRGACRYGARLPIAPLAANEGQWFALQCTPREERSAAGGLIGLRFDAYLPLISVKERHGRGAYRLVERPMFPSYLFLRCLDRADHFERLRHVPGVHHVIAGTLALGAIDAIRRAEANYATKAGKKALRWDFSIGEHVRVSDGPFASFYAEIEAAVDDTGRITALVNIFGRHTRVEFDADQLERL